MIYGGILDFCVSVELYNNLDGVKIKEDVVVIVNFLENEFFIF